MKIKKYVAIQILDQMRTGSICKLIWQISSSNLHRKTRILYPDCLHQGMEAATSLGKFFPSR